MSHHIPKSRFASPEEWDAALEAMMPQTNRLQTLHTFLDGLANEIHDRYGEGDAGHPAPSDVDLDQALAHAGDIARLLRLDVTSLATRPDAPAEGGPGQPAKR